jgi:hypothetical protein
MEMTKEDFAKQMAIDVKCALEQPLDGILYDLDLLPEQLEPGSGEDFIRAIIVELYKRWTDAILPRAEIVAGTTTEINGSVTYTYKPDSSNAVRILFCK